MLGRRPLFLLAAAASLLGLSPLPRSAPRSPEPRPPRPSDDFSPSFTTSRKAEKRARKREAARIKGGIPGAGLWRKCRAGGRVRGW